MSSYVRMPSRRTRLLLMPDNGAISADAECKGTLPGLTLGRKRLSSCSRSIRCQKTNGRGNPKNDLPIKGFTTSLFMIFSIISSPPSSDSLRSSRPCTANPIPLNPSQTKTNPSKTFGNLASS